MLSGGWLSDQWLFTLEGLIEAHECRYEHPIKGQGIYAYVSLREGEALDDALKKELVMTVRGNIGAFAAPDVVHWAPGLPKTRSGKIMRRVSSRHMLAAFMAGDCSKRTRPYQMSP